MSLLTPALPPMVTVRDPSLPVLALMRILNGLNSYWPSLYEVLNGHHGTDVTRRGLIADVTQPPGAKPIRVHQLETDG